MEFLIVKDSVNTCKVLFEVENAHKKMKNEQSTVQKEVLFKTCLKIPFYINNDEFQAATNQGSCSFLTCFSFKVPMKQKLEHL